MDIIYLDQNKWIELAQVHAGSQTPEGLATLYNQLLNAVERGKVLFPLSLSHLIETSKRNDPISRGHVVKTQAQLSRGFAYRSRAGRLEMEIRITLHHLFSIDPPVLAKNWTIVPSFLQAFEPLDAFAAAKDIKKLAFINTFIDPSKLYVDYMNNQNDTERRMAHSKIAADTVDLVSRIEARRARLSGKSVDLRRRVYSAQLFIDHQDLFIRILNDMGYSFNQLQAIGERAGRALIEEVPTLNVEAEMAARLESKTGTLHSNDVLDILAFCTAIPYSDRIIAEKSTISLARQAKLNAQYKVVLSQSLNDLLNVYSET